MGCFCRAIATALASMALTVTPLGFSCAYSASKSSVKISLCHRKDVIEGQTVVVSVVVMVYGLA